MKIDSPLFYVHDISVTFGFPENTYVLICQTYSCHILILQAFRRFTYVTAHSPTIPSLYLRHNSFSNPSVASPTSQLILQTFFRLSYVTGFSLTLPGEPPLLSDANPRA